MSTEKAQCDGGGVGVMLRQFVPARGLHQMVYRNIEPRSAAGATKPSFRHSQVSITVDPSLLALGTPADQIWRPANIVTDQYPSIFWCGFHRLPVHVVLPRILLSKTSAPGVCQAKRIVALMMFCKTSPDKTM
jgi:hypothetical protein